MNAFCVLEVNFLKWEESIISFKWNKLEKRKSSNRLEREIYLAKTWLHRFLNNILIFDPLCTFTNFRNPKPSFLGVLQNYCLLWYQIHILGILGRYLDQVEIFVNFQFKYVCILHETLQSVFPIRSCIKFFSNSKPLKNGSSHRSCWFSVNTWTWPNFTPKIVEKSQNETAATWNENESDICTPTDPPKVPESSAITPNEYEMQKKANITEFKEFFNIDEFKKKCAEVAEYGLENPPPRVVREIPPLTLTTRQSANRPQIIGKLENLA